MGVHANVLNLQYAPKILFLERDIASLNPAHWSYMYIVMQLNATKTKVLRIAPRKRNVEKTKYTIDDNTIEQVN